jgi:hypothetical protein
MRISLHTCPPASLSYLLFPDLQSVLRQCRLWSSVFYINLQGLRNVFALDEVRYADNFMMLSICFFDATPFFLQVCRQSPNI